jgi:hypothetical protein
MAASRERRSDPVLPRLSERETGPLPPLPSNEEPDDGERERTDAHIANAIAPLIARIEALEREVAALKRQLTAKRISRDRRETAAQPTHERARRRRSRPGR